MPITVSRAIDVLDLLSASKNGCTVSEVALSMGMSTASASRMIRTLRDAGVVSRDDQTGRIFPGMKLWTFGAGALRRLDFRRIALPSVGAALPALGRPVNLGIPEQDEVFWVEHIDMENQLVVATPVGRHFPYHAMTMGKAILAFMPPEFIERILNKEMDQFTEKTLTNPDDLRAELTQIRRRGFALNHGEFRPEGLGIAVPIVNESGTAIAGLSVPAAEDELHSRSAIVQSIVGLGRSISWQLGYTKELGETWI